MMQRVLIISYIFPPYPGVGGRRWGKFAKYIKRRGYEVTALSTLTPFENEVSQWIDDVEGIRNIQIIDSLGRWFYTPPKTIFHKGVYKFILAYLYLFKKGDYYDRATFSKNKFLKKAIKIIELEHTKTVIVSGPPFHLVYQICKLKESFPNLNVIADIRDSWTMDNLRYSQKKEKAHSYEKKLEELVVRNCDFLISVNESMTLFYNKKFPQFHHKFKTIINGYDRDDFENLLIENDFQPSPSEISLAFVGSLYPNLEYIINPFYKALLYLKKENPKVYKKLKFRFYGNIYQPYIKKANDLELDCLQFCGHIPKEKAYEKMANADLCMLFLLEHYAHSLSTKFCEYVALKKKVAVFSKKGNSTNFIEQKGIGYAIFPDDVIGGIMKLVKSVEAGELSKHYEIDHKLFDIDYLVDDVIELIG